MNFKEIDDNLRNMAYRPTLLFPTRVPIDHIFDATKSAEWNQARAKQHNAMFNKNWRAWLDDKNDLESKFRDDLCEAVMEYSSLINQIQAKQIVITAWEDSHSMGLKEVLGRAEELADFVDDILDLQSEN